MHPGIGAPKKLSGNLGTIDIIIYEVDLLVCPEFRHFSRFWENALLTIPLVLGI
jgi:hypothetical protein